MDHDYKNKYTKEYYDQYGTQLQGYADCSETKGFLKETAARLNEELHPRTVLDVGCAMGYLVEAFRDLGVEAYGIDVSDYAVSQVRDDIKPYCRAASCLEPLPEDFPEHFDLVANIEVAEHLYEGDGDVLLDQLCKWGDKVVFSSTDTDFSEPTHVNVQMREKWAKKFADRGFYRDFEHPLPYLTQQAACFMKQEPSAPDLAEDYEKLLREEKTGLLGAIDAGRAAGEEKAKALFAQIAQLEEAVRETNENAVQEINKLREDEAASRKHYERIIRKKSKVISELEKAVAERGQVIESFQNSLFWRLTKPFRWAMDHMKAALRNTWVGGLYYRALVKLRTGGYRGAAVALQRRKASGEYILKNMLTDEQRKIEEKTAFENPAVFSVIVPVYNCPQQFLREMIDSVVSQTYPNWELCLADGSDDKHAYVGEICREYAQKDQRILYRHLDKNLGIADNTNAAIAMSTGDYIALFDHDDMLHPSALYHVMTAIQEKNADFLYTDECSFRGKITNVDSINFKPDFAPDMLRSSNYICHLSVFSRELLDKAGLFSSDYDGSQDYDMILRLTEKANCIVHIPRVLYYWRIHQNSVAQDISAKPYCLESARKAIKHHIERLGLKGEVVDSMVVTTYKVEYEIKGNPLISILIPNMDHTEDLDKCLTSIFDNSTYRNYQIVIVENNSKEQKTFEYYKTLERDPRVKIVKWEAEFNYSAINNFGARNCDGEYILLLNNDVEIITPNWLEEMLMFAQREDVGAVGAKLLYPDDTIQHAGVIIGILGGAGHSHKSFKRWEPGYSARILIAQNLSACTAACLMVRKDVFDSVGGLDEEFQVAFNDVDFCLRIREKGYLIVYTPYAELHHYESKSRGYEDNPEKQKRFLSETLRLRKRWKEILKNGDPYYNPNLTLVSESFLYKKEDDMLPSYGDEDEFNDEISEQREDS